MPLLSEQATERLAAIWAVANTPAYLLRHFRQDAEVEELSSTQSPEALVATVAGVERLPTPTCGQLVEAYAALVALTFKDVTAVVQAKGSTRFDGLRWAEEILQLWVGGYRPSTVTHLTPGPLIVSPGSEWGAATGSTVRSFASTPGEASHSEFVVLSPRARIVRPSATAATTLATVVSGKGESR